MCVQRAAHGQLQVRKQRADGWTTERKTIFLDRLAETLCVEGSARAAGMSATGPYALRRRDAAFAAAWEAIIEDGYAALEMHVLRQALHGTEREERVRDADSGAMVTQKLVRTMPLGMAMRLVLARKAEKARAHAGILEPGMPRGGADDGTLAIIREELAAVRARMKVVPDGQPPGDPVADPAGKGGQI